MSLYERVPVLSLDSDASPRTSAAHAPIDDLSPFQLIRWILWDPLALALHLTPVTSAVDQVAKQNQQRSFAHFLQKVLADGALRSYVVHFTLAFAFAVVCMAVLMGIGVASGLLLPPAAPLLTLFGTWITYYLFGFLLALAMMSIGLWINSVAFTTIWGFYFGVGLPMIFFQLFWLQTLNEQEPTGLLFTFGVTASLLFGSLLNHARSLLQRLDVTGEGLALSQYLPLVLLLLYGYFLAKMFLATNSATIAPWQIISALIVSLAVAVAAFIRLDDYLLARLRLPAAQKLFTMKSAQAVEDFARSIPRVSYWAPPQLTELLHHWLDVDESDSLTNAHKLWCHTNLHAMVIKCVQSSLADQQNNDRLIGRVLQIADPQYNWALEEFFGAEAALTLPFGLKQLRRLVASGAQQQREPNQQRKQLRHEYRLGSVRKLNYQESDAAWRAAMAGILYLQSKQAAKAATAFTRIPHSAFAKELALLSHTFAQLLQEENLALAKPPIVTPPPPPHRRPVSWQALQIFGRIHHGAWLHQRCNELERRAVLRAEIRDDFKKLHTLQVPQPEAVIVDHLKRCWRSELGDWFRSGQQPRAEEIESPFIFAKPLTGETAFVGRQPQLQQLEQCNNINNSRPVLLHGAAKVGKTSLLNRFAKVAEQTVTLIPVYSESVLRGSKIDQQLALASCQAIARAVTGQVPSAGELEEKLGNDPLHFLQSYLTRICTRTEERMFVLVLDNFIELLHPQQASGRGLMPSPAYVEQFLQMLHELLNSLQNFNVIFVTRKEPKNFLHQAPWQLDSRLDGIEPIAVDNLTPEETERLLQHPTADFLLRCATDAVVHVYRRTDGRPFLVQLLGSQLVQEYNQSVRAQQPIAPFFLAKDFAQIERRSEFVQQSNWYASLH